MSVKDGDDPDHDIGDFVYAREMSSLQYYRDTGDNEPMLLYFRETVLGTGPVWTEGWYEDNVSGWMTAFGKLGEPEAWAPLPKTR